jgi:hypothetical protein
MTKNIDLIMHTTCGIDFEMVDATTKNSLTGRMYWCGDEEAEEKESSGWAFFRKKATQKGWTIVEEVWS